MENPEVVLQNLMDVYDEEFGKYFLFQICLMELGLLITTDVQVLLPLLVAPSSILSSCISTKV